MKYKFDRKECLKWKYYPKCAAHIFSEYDGIVFGGRSFSWDEWVPGEEFENLILTREEKQMLRDKTTKRNKLLLSEKEWHNNEFNTKMDKLLE